MLVLKYWDCEEEEWCRSNINPKQGFSSISELIEEVSSKDPSYFGGGAYRLEKSKHISDLEGNL